MFPIHNTVPTRSMPLVTWGLIAANCVVFIFEASLDPLNFEWFVWRFALVPARDFALLTGDAGGPAATDYLRFVTNTFLHGGWLHLIVNMWTLWLFGLVVEDRLGHARYFWFYIGCGIVASLTHAMFNPDSELPALGASGAIAGVLGCFMRLFPLARVVVVVPIVFIPLFFQVPAFLFAGFWFLMQVLQGTAELLAPTTGGGVAWWAHIGGFVLGFVFAPILQQPRRRQRVFYPDEGVLGFDTSGRP